MMMFFTLHLSLSLSLSLISLHLFSRPPPQTLFFQLPLSPLVSFVPPNTAFSILPLIATQQNGSAASPTSENLSTFCGCKLCFSFFVSFFFFFFFLKVLVQSFAFDTSPFFSPTLVLYFPFQRHFSHTL